MPVRFPKNERVIRFPNSACYVATARRAIMEFVLTCGLGGQEYDDLRFAVGEAIAGTVEHGRRDRTYFCVRAWREINVIVVEVEDEDEDDGAGSASDAASAAFGLKLMRALVDRVSFANNGALVRLHKVFPGSEPHALGERGIA